MKDKLFTKLTFSNRIWDKLQRAGNILLSLRSWLKKELSAYTTDSLNRKKDSPDILPSEKHK